MSYDVGYSSKKKSIDDENPLSQVRYKSIELMPIQESNLLQASTALENQFQNFKRLLI